MYFGNATPNSKYTFTLQTQNGACPATTQTLTILTGAYIYDNLCFGATTTLNNIGVPGNNISWFSDAQGTIPIPGTTIIQGDTTYYAGFGDPACPDLLPVIVKYKVQAPQGGSEFLFCTASTWMNVGITETPITLVRLMSVE